MFDSRPPISRRKMLEKCSSGFGLLALAGLLNEDSAPAETGCLPPPQPRRRILPAEASRRPKASSSVTCPEASRT